MPPPPRAKMMAVESKRRSDNTANAAARTGAERDIVGVEDMVLLRSVTEDQIVSNLNKRFAKNQIYTYIGQVLICCNPFQFFPIYDRAHMTLYEDRNQGDAAPHIFAIGEAAFRCMVDEEDNQCVIISGESGAGKTEAAKQIMNYIAAVSGDGGNDAAVNEVKSIVLDSNPLLESFGNAMTLRNNNSSRFGKYFQLQFDRKAPRGGKVTNYLLEKSRVTRPGPGERSFHVFYQLLSGAPSETKRRLGLGSPDAYEMLRISGCYVVDNEGGKMDDRAEWADMTQSMRTVGISDAEKEDVLTLLAVVLHLSNITFRDCQVDGADGSQADQSMLQSAANVMGVDPAAMDYALTFRTLNTMAAGGGVETYQVPNNASQASAARDALAKDLYFRMFDWIVGKVNVALESCGQKTKTEKRRTMRRAATQDAYGGDDVDTSTFTSIGVLDIYGFEIFENNAFEQFCINFVNEKLQQIFIELTLRSEQEEYAAEGIAWKKIPFFDNKVVCDLIESKRPPGVFAILDDTCKAISGRSDVDDKFVAKLNSFQRSHPHFTEHNGGFTIKHYAGDVTYNAVGFCVANKDTLFQDLQVLSKSSAVPLIQALYPDEIDFDNRKQPTTAGYKIKRQCADLVDTLMDCTPHYVRCIKTNDKKRAGLFNSNRVSHQVRYLGLLENVKVRRAGFAYRVEFHRFMERFKIVAHSEWQRNARLLTHGTDYQMAEAILRAASAFIPELSDQAEAQLGKTKVFIKHPETYFGLQEVRKKMVGVLVVSIQSAYRRYRARRDLVCMRTEMAELFAQNGKEPTPSDIIRPYAANYLNDSSVRAALSELIEWHSANTGGGLNQERLIYADRVTKLVALHHKGGLFSSKPKGPDFEMSPRLLAVTDKALYIASWERTPVLKGGVPPPAGSTVPYRLILDRRTELGNIDGLTLSKNADDFIVIGQRPQPKVDKNKAHFMDTSGVSRCMDTQDKFGIFKRKHHCHLTGRVYCHDVVRNQAPLPDFGFYKPVDIHDNEVGKGSREMREDLIVCTEKKAELAAVLRRQVTIAMGGNVTPQGGGGQRGGGMGGGRTKNMVRATYDYAATQSDEINIREGDIFELLDDSNADWWTGKLANGQTGIFPSSYVQRERSVPAGGARGRGGGGRINYLLNIAFSDLIKPRVATVAALVRAPKQELSFEKSNFVNEVTVLPDQRSPNLRITISAPPGVAGARVKAVLQSQAEREERRRAEREAEMEMRRQNQAVRAEERRQAKAVRLAAKKEKRNAERAKRNAIADKKAQQANKLKGTNASFANRLKASNTSQKPQWMLARQQKMGGGRQENGRPSGNGGGAGFKMPVAASRPPPAPKSDWEEHTDPDSGDTYYYNPKTGESAWDKPAGFNPSSSGGQSGGGGSGGSSVAEGSMSFDDLLAAKRAGAAGMVGSQLERYLRVDQYDAAFGMSKSAFDALPGWKKTAAKKKAQLY